MLTHRAGGVRQHAVLPQQFSYCRRIQYSFDFTVEASEYVGLSGGRISRHNVITFAVWEPRLACLRPLALFCIHIFNDKRHEEYNLVWILQQWWIKLCQLLIWKSIAVVTQSLCWALILSTILLTKWQTSFVSDHPKWAEPLGLNEWEGDKRYVCHTHQNRKHVIKLWTHIWSRAQLVAGQLIHSSCPHWSSWQQRGNLRESATLHRSPILTKLVCWLTTIGSKPIEKRWIRWQLYSTYANSTLGSTWARSDTQCSHFQYGHTPAPPSPCASPTLLSSCSGPTSASVGYSHQARLGGTSHSRCDSILVGYGHRGFCCVWAEYHIISCNKQCTGYVFHRTLVLYEI